MADTVVISGALAQKPRHGGHTWVILQYLLGFRRLGWDVLFIDRLEPAMCADEAGAACGIEHSVNLRFFADVMGGFGLKDSCALLDESGESVYGVAREEARERVGGAAFLFNIMGYLKDEGLLARARKRVFLDIDPGFGQMWRDLGWHDPFAGHDLFVTIGEHIGRPGCAIPTCGLRWITTPQPVVLDYWEPRAEEGEWFSSVASWRGAYAPIEYKGETYGLRVHEFRRYAALPRLSRQPFRLALDIHPSETKDIELLTENGWLLLDPKSAVGGPRKYQEFIRGSKAEFMVAKGIYVKTRSGWFSDRSICYLASGRPVIAQDTGLSDLYPLGEGLLPFRTLDEAAAAVASVAGDYARHSRAARALAEVHFDSDKVLSRLLTKLDVG